MNKIIVFLSVFLILSSAAVAQNNANTGVFVNYKGYEIFIPTTTKYKVGQTIEITRSKWGNLQKYSNWAVNPSPVLEENQNEFDEKRVENCGDCTTGTVMMTYYFVKVKVMRTQ